MKVMKIPSSQIPKFRAEFKLSDKINCRDMRGKLITTIDRRPLEYGNMVNLLGQIYIVKGACVVNGRLNMNFEEIKTNDCQ